MRYSSFLVFHGISWRKNFDVNFEVKYSRFGAEIKDIYLYLPPCFKMMKETHMRRRYSALSLRASIHSRIQSSLTPKTHSDWVQVCMTTNHKFPGQHFHPKSQTVTVPLASSKKSCDWLISMHFINCNNYLSWRLRTVDIITSALQWVHSQLSRCGHPVIIDTC